MIFERYAFNRVHRTRTGEHGVPLHYFGNYGSFIRFISIIVFVSLLSGRPMNAPTSNIKSRQDSLICVLSCRLVFLLIYK